MEVGIIEKLTLCLKEWNPIVEALGQGKQSILIRKYGTNLDKFLLYPSSRYSKINGYLKSFQEEYHDFVEKNTPSMENKEIEIKYYAQCEKIFQKTSIKVVNLEKYSLWTNAHVKSYLNGKKAHIWLLRVYKLKNPRMVPIKVGQLYSKLETPINIEGSKPVLNEKNFSELEELLTKLLK